jgi:hypothetical protein
LKKEETHDAQICNCFGGTDDGHPGVHPYTRFNSADGDANQATGYSHAGSHADPGGYRHSRADAKTCCNIYTERRFVQR